MRTTCNFAPRRRFQLTLFELFHHVFKLVLLLGLFHCAYGDLIKKPHRSGALHLKNKSGGSVESPALASGNGFFARRNSGVTSSSADVQGLSPGHGGQAGKQLHKVLAGESSRNHVDAATGHSGVIGDTQGGDGFFDCRGDLAANDVAVGLEGHGE